MKMWHHTFVPLLAIVIVTCSLNHAVGQGSFIKSNELNNAALVYWQSFALLPNLTDEQTKLVNKIEVHVWADDSKISKSDGEELLKILEMSENSVQLIDQISDDTACDWGIVFAGPGTQLPHIGKARLLAKILQLSGDKALLLGMQDLAAQRYAQALRLGRHLGNQAIVLHLVGEKIEEYVVTSATRQIEGAPNTADCSLLAKGLFERIEKLPARSSVAGAYRNEKKYFHGWIENVLLNYQESSTAELEAAEDLFQAEGWSEYLRTSPIADRQRALDGMAKYYDRLIEFAEDDGSDLEARLAEWQKNSDRSITRSLLLAMMPTYQPIVKSRQVSQNWQEFIEKLQQASE